MKTLLFSYKFLFMTLMSLPLAMCSNDDDNNEIETPFESVTIDFSNSTLKKEETGFSVSGFNFINSNGKSGAFGVVDDDGIFLGSGAWIELDLNSIQGISKITITLFNNDATIGTLVSTSNMGTNVQEFTGREIPRRLSDFEINVEGKDLDALRIRSGESLIYSIKLE